MKFPKWAKGAALAMGTVLTVGIGKIAYDIHQLKQSGKNDLQTQMQAYDGQKLAQTLQSQTIDTAAQKRFDHNLDIYSGLLFYCGPNISKKIAGLETGDGHELIQEQDDQFIVWETGEQRSKSLEKILTVVDPATKMQMCATYDSSSNDLVFCYGGTDFSSAADLKNAGVSAFGGVTPRAAAAVTYTLEALNLFIQKHPDVKPTVSMLGHSAGGASLAAGTIAATVAGFEVNAQKILDGFGSKATYEAIAEATGVSYEELTKNVTSVAACKKDLMARGLDLFKTASTEVGTTEICSAEGHMGKKFIVGYNNDRLNGVKRSPAQN